MPPPELRLRIKAEASVAPSEEPAKVRAALASIFGECRLSVEENPRRVTVASEDGKCLTKLHDQLRDRRVRAAARRLLLARREGDSVTLMFNRQAAHAGVLAMCGSEEESPLGPIYLTIESEEVDRVIEWLTAYEAG